MSPSMIPKVLIVGRPNVGKSALFNRLCEQRKAIVHQQPGVTRDLLMSRVEWQGRTFILVDSGGIDFLEESELQQRVQNNVKGWIEQADLLLFLVDGQAGPQSLDEEVSRLLRRSGKPALLAVNKIDHASQLPRSLDFFSLGWSDPIPVSGLNSFNVGDLLDAIVEGLPPPEGSPQEVPLEKTLVGSIAIVGRPNVGKSSLLNALLGEERSIVSTLPGTTRDVVDIIWHASFGDALLVDTAGIRRKSRVGEDVEYYSVLRATKALERADLAFLVLDANEGILAQDRRIAGLIQDANKACLVLVNKADLVDLGGEKWQRFLPFLRRELDFLPFAEVLPVSALTGWNLKGIPSLTSTILNSYNTKVTTGVLNRYLSEIQEANPPAQAPGKAFKIFYATQKGTAPPNFICFVNKRENLHFSYERHLHNELRQKLGLVGTPIRLQFRSRLSRTKGKD